MTPPVPSRRAVASPVLAVLLVACSGAQRERAPVPAVPIGPGGRPAPTTPRPPVVSRPSPARVSPPADPLDSLSFADLISTLRARAESGADRDLAGHADMLRAIERHGLDASTEVRMRRADEVEQALAARWKGGIAFATVTSYLEPDADAERLRRVYLAYDRYTEWTGKPDVTLVSREGADVIAAANGVRNGPFGLKFGAKWRFRAHPIARGKARINVIRMVDAPDTEHMRETKSLLVVFQEPGGSRVVEAAASDVDIDPPPLLGGIAISIAAKDVRDRATSLRSHWQELPR